MRLLEHRDGQFQLNIYNRVSDLPPYAILSHTWGPDTEEVSFRDLVEHTGTHKAGYRKLTFCAEQAKRDGLRYFWVDTCCIDKTNSTELATAINSMFRWYRDAARCYVYLSDLSIAGAPCDQGSAPPWKSAFRKHRWFTRGWTLQELLAPASVPREAGPRDHRDRGSGAPRGGLFSVRRRRAIPVGREAPDHARGGLGLLSPGHLRRLHAPHIRRRKGTRDRPTPIRDCSRHGSQLQGRAAHPQPSPL
ncbi:hypothetical protein VTK73DRAFT_2097 [Phialemonium thermophilum]|uniref:Heterokaryon incompatibility domain-containing protein n=1 Tax=Phialemonium thermophilum TaxID=223376 RepID=A0ABR3VSL1_9PEZI